MVEILSGSQGNVTGIKISGKLTDKEYEEVLIPKLQTTLKAEGKTRLLCYMDSDFKGWEWIKA